MSVLNIASVNATSLVNYDRVLEVERFINKFNIDFCLIQETHLKNKFVKSFKHFNIHRNDSNVGILIFARDKYKIERAFCTCN